jgi:Rha family phage regulatory protein
MNDLVIMKDQQAVTSSLQVAETFNKNHRDVLKAIDEMRPGVAQNFADLFSEDTYTHPQNKQQYRMYYMNRDGFTLLAMGFTGNDAMKFKLQYINAFNKLEEEHKQNQIDVNELSPELKMFNQIFQTVAANELENKKLNHKVDNIAEIVSLNTTDWRKTSQSIIKKIAITQGGYEAYRDVAKSIYDETDKRAGSNLKTRLTNLRKNMALEGASKSKRDKANKLDVIENDKRLKEIYMSVVKDFAIKNKVWENEY